MQRPLDSAIGLPRRSTSASRMLVFLIPADVRRSFMLPPRVITAGEPFGPRADPYALETRKPPKTHRLPPDPALGPWEAHSETSSKRREPRAPLAFRPGVR